MRKLLKLSLAMLCLSLFSNSYAQQEKQINKISFSIEGELKDIKENATVWVGVAEPYALKGMAFKGDVSKGKFSIKGETFNPTIGTLSLFLLDQDGKPRYLFPDAPKFEFYLAAGTTSIILSDSFKVAVVNSPAKKEQLKLETFNKKMAVYENELSQLYLKQYNLSHSKVASDSFEYKSTSKRINEINALTKPEHANFIRENKSSFLGLALLRYTLMAGSVFKTTEVQEMLSQFNPAMKETEMGREIERLLDIRLSPSFELVGKQMPDAEIYNTNDEKVKLTSFKGKYLLLDFWASWCAPCRKANPDLMALYSKYGNSKMEFLSVSIDMKKDDWLKAVKEDGLTWPQLLDNNEGKSGYAGVAIAAYKGAAVPISFVITPTGQILKFNPTKDELEKIVKEVYAVK